MFCRSLFVLLVIILSVFLRLTAPDYPFSIFMFCSGNRLVQFGLLIDGTSALSMKEYWTNSASYEKKKKSTRRRAQLVPMGMPKIY
jgi:hypothetical protein